MSKRNTLRNPFRFSDSNKRYHTYDYYLRKRYGGKCVKLSLDAGFTCPNIDGTCGRGGCIYCSPRGSGDFTYAGLSLAEQYSRQRELLARKWETVRCIPYLQAHTNTYAPVDTLRRVYREVLSLPDAVAFHLATRADCLSEGVLSLLREVSEKIDLTVELGLQT
ncbi:MAG: TIGR01212 family radical SAM protein, partial [Clostridia bacterium]|nr:TIGR01212 family radical SAM protein [Clostridia bacterium]